MLKDVTLNGNEFSKGMLKSIDVFNGLSTMSTTLRSLDDAVTINDPELMKMISPDFDKLMNITTDLNKDIQEIQRVLIDADKRAGNPWENMADQKTVKTFWTPSDKSDTLKEK
ncbi:hypothetical protein [Companilactobacillus jidongensis]|uniref:hypothetical protein n=1 Tax=Companilactobacillus jidongensis TaxID=2486006 RepID=UPI000F7B174C|nr:hypothetical protein [Companilactobacillus jidongensis]